MQPSRTGCRARPGAVFAHPRVPILHCGHLLCRSTPTRRTGPYDAHRLGLSLALCSAQGPPGGGDARRPDLRPAASFQADAISAQKRACRKARGVISRPAPPSAASAAGPGDSRALRPAPATVGESESTPTRSLLPAAAAQTAPSTRTSRLVLCARPGFRGLEPAR